MNNNYEHLPIKEATLLKHFKNICEHLEKGDNVELWKGIAFGYTFGAMMLHYPEDYSLEVVDIIRDLNGATAKDIESTYNVDVNEEIIFYNK